MGLHTPGSTPQTQPAGPATDGAGPSNAPILGLSTGNPDIITDEADVDAFLAMDDSIFEQQPAVMPVSSAPTNPTIDELIQQNSAQGPQNTGSQPSAAATLAAAVPALAQNAAPAILGPPAATTGQNAAPATTLASLANQMEQIRNGCVQMYAEQQRIQSDQALLAGNLARTAAVLTNLGSHAAALPAPQSVQASHVPAAAAISGHTLHSRPLSLPFVPVGQMLTLGAPATAGLPVRPPLVSRLPVTAVQPAISAQRDASRPNRTAPFKLMRREEKFTGEKPGAFPVWLHQMRQILAYEPLHTTSERIQAVANCLSGAAMHYYLTLTNDGANPLAFNSEEDLFQALQKEFESSSKVTAELALRAIKQGKLSLDEFLNKFRQALIKTDLTPQTAILAFCTNLSDPAMARAIARKDPFPATVEDAFRYARLLRDADGIGGAGRVHQLEKGRPTLLAVQEGAQPANAQPSGPPPLDNWPPDLARPLIEGFYFPFVDASGKRLKLSPAMRACFEPPEINVCAFCRICGNRTHDAQGFETCPEMHDLNSNKKRKRGNGNGSARPPFRGRPAT